MAPQMDLKMIVVMNLAPVVLGMKDGSGDHWQPFVRGSDGQSDVPHFAHACLAQVPCGTLQRNPDHCFP